MIQTVLFVCTGNTCRSPMAEYLFRRKLGGVLDVHCSSAGLAAPDGAPASSHAITVMREIGCDLSAHRSRSLTPEMIDEAGLIVVMTSAHRDAVCRLCPQARDRVRLLHAFGVEQTGKDVSDPFGQSESRYRQTRNELDDAITDMAIFLNSQGAPLIKKTAQKKDV